MTAQHARDRLDIDAVYPHVLQRPRQPELFNVESPEYTGYVADLLRRHGYLLRAASFALSALSDPVADHDVEQARSVLSEALSEIVR